MIDSIKRIGAYTIETICPNVYAIEDEQLESMYLVCGSDRALLIDTGSNPESVMPVIRALWDGPVDLVLTHAHFDHMYHCDEFSSVSVGAEDIAAWNKSLWLVVWLGTVGSGKKAKHYPMENYHSLKEGDTIDLGGKIIRVLNAKGHTPGSLIYIDETDKCLFVGDAFGWMWMPGCSREPDWWRSSPVRSWAARRVPLTLPQKGPVGGWNWATGTVWNSWRGCVSPNLNQTLIDLPHIQ